MSISEGVKREQFLDRAKIAYTRVALAVEHGKRGPAQRARRRLGRLMAYYGFGEVASEIGERVQTHVDRLRRSGKV